MLIPVQRPAQPPEVRQGPCEGQQWRRKCGNRWLALLPAARQLCVPEVAIERIHGRNEHRTDRLDANPYQVSNRGDELSQGLRTPPAPRRLRSRCPRGVAENYPPRPPRREAWLRHGLVGGQETKQIMRDARACSNN